LKVPGKLTALAATMQTPPSAEQTTAQYAQLYGSLS